MAVKKFKGFVATKFIGSKATLTFEIDTDDEMTDEEIEEYAREIMFEHIEIMFEHIEWNYEESEDE